MFFSDVITARVEVLEVLRERNRIRLKTVCTNQRGEDVLTGDALVMPSKTSVEYVRPQAGTGLVSLWTLGPWAWAAQGTAVLGMMGLSALSAMAGVAGAGRD